MRAAAAKIAIERGPDLRVGRIRIFIQQRRRADQNAGNAVAALLKRNPNPTGADVKAALDRNLCRCGSHNRIVRAVLRAAAEMQAQ